MSLAFEIAAIAVLSVVTVAGVRYLRRHQPDPNPAIEARVAAALAAGQPLPTYVERRINPLPYVGRDRRAEGASVAQAWRNAA